MSMATQVPRPPRLTAAAAAAAAKRSLDPETCGSYDMTPIGVIMPHAPVYCLGASYNWKWFFTGGADGRVTKYDFPATVAGKAPLTQAQRSGMPDTATRSGHQLSFFYAEEAAATREYWRRVRGMPPIEPPPAPVAPVPAVAGAPGTGLGAAPNATVAAVPDSTTGGNDRPLTATMVPVRAADGSLRVSPVFSMAVHSQALFVAVGTRHGGIGLFTGRHDEGSQFACLSGGHTDVVSALALGSPAALGGEFAAEDRLISGSWDRSVVCWDLNTGQQISRIPAAATTDPTADAVVPPLIRSQVSALQWHPTDPNLVLVTQSAGQVSLLDMRVPPGSPAVEFGMPAKTPPWALSSAFNPKNNHVLVGRRNERFDEYSPDGTLIRSLTLPRNSGPVTQVKIMPNHRSAVVASTDTIRLWDLEHRGKGVAFSIIPGHHGAVVSDIAIDNTCKYLLTASGSRGWDTTVKESELCYLYQIEPSNA